MLKNSDISSKSGISCPSLRHPLNDVPPPLGVLLKINGEQDGMGLIACRWTQNLTIS